MAGNRRSGRRTIPTARKKAERAPSLKNRNKEEPQVPAIVHAPPAPLHLHVWAQEEWARVAPLMVDVGMLTELDLAPLTAYCEAFAVFRVASEKMARLAAQDDSSAGLVVQSPSGAVYLNPLHAAKSKAAADMVRYAGELGLTPSARASIIVAERGGMGKAQRAGASQVRGPDLAAKYNL